MNPTLKTMPVGGDPTEPLPDHDYYEEDEDEDRCYYCEGEGGDPYCDYCLPCPKCGL